MYALEHLAGEIGHEVKLRNMYRGACQTHIPTQYTTKSMPDIQRLRIAATATVASIFRLSATVCVCLFVLLRLHTDTLVPVSYTHLTLPTTPYV